MSERSKFHPKVKMARPSAFFRIAAADYQIAVCRCFHDAAHQARLRAAQERIVVIAACEILDQRARPERQRSLAALSIVQTELDVGDTVIHLDHGMAVLKGIETIDAAGQTVDMVRLEYADETTLMVPRDEVGAIWRYGSDAEAVTLDKLHSEAWQKRRAKIEAEIADTATRLLALSAARAEAKATAFAPEQGDTSASAPASPIRRARTRLPPSPRC